MVTKAEITQLKNNKDLGRRLNILFGDTPDTSSLQEYILSPQSTGVNDFTVSERRQINAAINACCRGGIMTPGTLRITEPELLRQKKDIGINRVELLHEAFKHQ